MRAAGCYAYSKTAFVISTSVHLVVLFLIIWRNAEFLVCPRRYVWVIEFTNNVSEVPVQMPDDPPPHNYKGNRSGIIQNKIQMWDLFVQIFNLQPPASWTIIRLESGCDVWPVRYVQSPLNRTGCIRNWLLFLVATVNNLPLRASPATARDNSAPLDANMFPTGAQPLLWLQSILFSAKIISILNIHRRRWNRTRKATIIFFFYVWCEWQYTVHWDIRFWHFAVRSLWKCQNSA